MLDTTGFNDKDSKNPVFRELYEKYDFLTAYSKHTDLRVHKDPLWSIGRADEWESHGELQLNFLIEYAGMTPQSVVVDYGCGIGRAARRLVPYLNPGHYVGLDISPAVLEYARGLAEREGWDERHPTFRLTKGDFDVEGPVDIVWAHSVFTHLPEDIIRRNVEQVRKALKPGGQFLFTYTRADRKRRTGLKQFRYPTEFFVEVAREFGLKGEPLPVIFPASQQSFRMSGA